MNDLTIGVKELAEILHLSEHTIHGRLSKTPDKLPPRLHLPGERTRPLWLKSDVQAWLEKHRKPPKRPGRPLGPDPIKELLHERKYPRDR